MIAHADIMGDSKDRYASGLHREESKGAAQ